MANPTPIKIDATEQSLGRLASRTAILLQGKRIVGHQKHEKPVQKVIIMNCSKLRIGKKKMEQKLHYRTSGYPGGLRSRPLGESFAKDPCGVVRLTVRGMLPKNRLRDIMLKNLELKS